MNRLNVRQVASIATPGRHGDGGGLYLDVSAEGRKTWVFLYRSPTVRVERTGKLVGKQREKGLGSAQSITLAQARERAAEARAIVASGADPLDALEVDAPASVPTFGSVADRLISAMEVGWKNEKHRAQWRSTLKGHAAPLREIRVDAITTDDVLSVLEPIWTTKAETASRLRGRIEKVLDAAKAMGHRHGENPARWRGHLDHLLPRRQKLQRGHHPAMAWNRVPVFISELREMKGTGALALEFLILTAARSGEARGAQWSEIDLDLKIWSVPASRMKAGKEHRVPLTCRTLEILKLMEPVTNASGLVFPGKNLSVPLSEMALEAVLRRLGAKPATVHGFRSSFRDWCGEHTEFPRELAEDALAHNVGNSVERAYRRGDALERRRPLMAAWEAYGCAVANSKKRRSDL
jgi:integrase